MFDCVVSFAIAALVTAHAVTERRDQGTWSNGVACGPASMAIALRLLDQPVMNHELASLADAGGTTSLATLKNYSTQRGLYAEVVRLAPDELVSLQHVAILHLRIPGAGRELIEHFVVFAGPARGGFISIVDPLGGESDAQPLPQASALQYWTGHALVISNRPLPLSLGFNLLQALRSPIAISWVYVPTALVAIAWMLHRGVLTKRATVVGG